MRMKEAGAAKTAATRALLGVASMAFAATAFAAEPANNHGVMQFANVQVVQADATVVAAATKAAEARAQAKQPALKTYVNADTGLPRAPTEAELAAEAASAAVVEAADGPAPRVFTVARSPNVQGARIGSESASYVMVHRDASGALVESCVQGETQAAHALHNATPEVANDR